MGTFQRSTSRRPAAGQPLSWQRRGLTLVELLMVSAVMAILATTLAALATTVQVANQQQLGHGLALQHGQVAIGRIERAIQGATVNQQFPGFIVMSETVNGSTFPDTLVVWKPKGQPAAPDGLPRVNELVVFTPASDDSARFVELRRSSDTSEVPPLANDDDWRYLMSKLKSSAYADYGSRAAVLTDLMRVGVVTNSSGQPVGKRGCIRFEQVLRPSAAEWKSYQTGSVSWKSLPWVQGIYGANFGQRQALCRIELQLRPGDVVSHDKQLAIPFFGSAAIYYSLER
ncbi:MAG: prepilin-type N-terminal cleavage/methylation domain-containing protein [Planctomycetota bacterium]|nr:prepilin-type N-terminal cleavage/methylation domain-containing protein [Planctomycetota bacterium]